MRILQFGKGNFLRAFTDWMVDVLNEKTDFNGAVTIVQTHSRETDNRFAAQEGLYHLVTNGLMNGSPVREIRLISSVAGVVNPFEDYAAYLKTAENPDLQFIISNTTEAGITFDPRDNMPDTPAQSFPGKLTSLLYHRYKFFRGDINRALTILPCELIENNGEVLRNVLCQYIAHWNLEDGFRQWITNHTVFCNTLVDRIVPGFPKDKTEELWREIGFRDQLVVTAEPYHLWVIQPLGSTVNHQSSLQTALPLQQAGLNVKYVNDLAPYRTSKVRILNGAHTCMVPIAYLKGLRTVKEAVDDMVVGAFVREAIDEEIIPTLDLPAPELKEFAGDVMERFQNPFIRHELISIALNSVSKFQVRVLPSILVYYTRINKPPFRLLRSLAALILFYRGEWNGIAIPLKDTPEVLAIFGKAWESGNADHAVDVVLSSDELWKTDLAKIPGLAASVKSHIRELSDQSD